jgi:ribonuclease BN (tRNA processing enzyme)
VCFSHLRWDFVYQRPQHLMSRFAQQFRTFFIEEPLFHEGEDSLQTKLTKENVWIVTPYINCATKDKQSVVTRQKQILNILFAEKKIEKFIAWYYTPMALKISSRLKP